MPEQDEKNRNAKKKPPSTADILKQIRQKKNLPSSASTDEPKTIPKAKPVTKPKTAEPTLTQPKLTKPKAAIAKKQTTPVETTVSKKAAEPIADLDKEIKPSFLDDAIEPETILPKIAQGGIPPRKPHKRFVSAKVISKSAYQRMKDLIFKRSFLNVIFLFWMTCIVGYAIVWVIIQYGNRDFILKNVDKGWIALDENKQDEAKKIFGATLAFYENYRTGITKYLWFNDGQTEIAALQMALGYRNMGEMEKGIQCFKQVCLHDPFTTNIWMDDKMRENIVQFIDPDQWSKEELLRMYWHLMQGNPADWDLGAVYLPLMTEWVAMNMVPVQERFVNAFDVVYGLPLKRNEGNSITVNAETFYKQEMKPGGFNIFIPSGIPEEAVQRLDWYIQQGNPCVMFCKQLEGNYILDGIEGIYLNDTLFIDTFNDTVKAFSYE